MQCVYFLIVSSAIGPAGFKHKLARGDMFKIYKDIDGEYEIAAYAYGPDWIQVYFCIGDIYEYTYHSAGQQNIETMKRFADSGENLNLYINTFVKKRFASHIR
jgi:hypothetical protein